jgi:hypothetical protein
MLRIATFDAVRYMLQISLPRSGAIDVPAQWCDEVIEKPRNSNLAIQSL